MCMHVCVTICVCARECIICVSACVHCVRMCLCVMCVCVYLSIYAYVFARACVCTLVSAYVCVCVCLSVCLSVCVCSNCLWLCLCVYAQVYASMWGKWLPWQQKRSQLPVGGREAAVWNDLRRTFLDRFRTASGVWKGYGTPKMSQIGSLIYGITQLIIYFTNVNKFLFRSSQQHMTCFI